MWSSCSPDFGKRAVLDRFGQIAPKVLIATSATATAPRMLPRSTTPDPAARIAPTMITELMALVTLISGVCKAGVTCQTT